MLVAGQACLWSVLCLSAFCSVLELVSPCCLRTICQCCRQGLQALTLQLSAGTAGAD